MKGLNLILLRTQSAQLHLQSCMSLHKLGDTHIKDTKAYKWLF